MKWTRTIVSESHRGISIETHYHKQKNGKELLWIELRQKNGKAWKMYTSLAYGRSANVCFVREVKG